MSSHTPQPDKDSGSLYEYFEEALKLYDAGKPYQSVLARCPEHLRPELKKQIELATRLVTLSPSMAQPRNQAHRTMQRSAFMSEVHKLKPQPAIGTNTRKPWLEVMREALQDFADRLGGLAPRLTPQAVPLLVALSLLLGGTIGVGTAAASALPGDFTYPVKEFVRETRESFASSEEKEKVIHENENARRADNEKAAIERSHLITVTQVLVFYMKSDWLLDIGGQSVMPGYPVDSSGKLAPMTYIGDPKPGNLVRLTYMIFPGKPNFIYGVELEVIPPVAEPTPASAQAASEPAQATATPVQATATAVPTLPATPCEPVKPEGWIVYRVQTNDNLTSMAIKMSTAYAQILAVNCRPEDDLAAGASIFLPAVEGITIPDPNGETETPIATLVPSITPTEIGAETATPEIEATSTEEGVATMTPASEEPTSEADASPTATLEDEPTVVETPGATEESGVATATSEATESSPTSEVTPEATPTPVSATPTGESTVETPEATATESPNATPTVSEATPTPENTTTPVTSDPTATSITAPTIEPTIEVIATPIPAEPTVEPIATNEPPTPVVEPTLVVPVEPTVQSSSVISPTPEATQPVSPLTLFIPQSRSAAP